MFVSWAPALEATGSQLAGGAQGTAELGTTWGWLILGTTMAHMGLSVGLQDTAQSGEEPAGLRRADSHALNRNPWRQSTQPLI